MHNFPIDLAFHAIYYFLASFRAGESFKSIQSRFHGDIEWVLVVENYAI